jgi:hypothetical protein
MAEVSSLFGLEQPFCEVPHLMWKKTNRDQKESSGVVELVVLSSGKSTPL